MLGMTWLRGREMSRIEGLSDAVFRFEITLLVVSLEVPNTFDELLDRRKRIKLAYDEYRSRYAGLITVVAPSS